jgi:hypothetical protein
MVDILNHLIFDGSPLILPIMVGISGATVYLVALAADRLLNTGSNIWEKRKTRINKEEKHDRMADSSTKPITKKKAVKKKVVKK